MNLPFPYITRISKRRWNSHPSWFYVCWRVPQNYTIVLMCACSYPFGLVCSTLSLWCPSSCKTNKFLHRLESYGILYDKFANSIQHLRLIKIAYLCTLSIHIQIQYLYRYYLISFLIAIGLAITLYVFAYVNSFLPLHQTYLCLNMLLGDTLPQVKLALT